MPSSALHSRVRLSFPTRRSSDLDVAGRFSAARLRPPRRVARLRVRLEGTSLLDADGDGGAADRHARARGSRAHAGRHGAGRPRPSRSEEHTSELQSLRHLVCRLLPSTPASDSLSLHDALPISTSPADFPPLVYDRLGASLVFAFAWKELPYLTLTAMAVLLTDTRELEEVARTLGATARDGPGRQDRKSTRLNSSHLGISYAVFCPPLPRPTLFPYTTLFRSRRRRPIFRRSSTTASARRSSSRSPGRNFPT